MVEKSSAKTEAFERAKGLIKVHGIISIVLGTLGVLFGLIAVVIFAIISTIPMPETDVVVFFILGLVTLLFFVLPHVYFIVAGVQLANAPEPRVARVLIIINLVIGVLWGNIVILVFSVLNLVQFNDYESEYKKLHAKK